jgi:tetratricopeptide (TPR) repeat protein
MFYTAAFIFIGVCIAAMLSIVVRKFPQLTLINTSVLPKERETRKKKEIIHDRVGRLAAEGWKNFLARVRPVLKGTQTWFRRQYTKVLVLDYKYQAAKPEKRELPASDLRAIVDRLEDEASDLVKAGKAPEAEKKYVEIIRIDPKNLTAYRGLGELYLEAKNYAQAKETFEFLVKMSVKECCVAHKGRASRRPEADEPGTCPASPAVQAEIAKNYFSLSNACRLAGDLTGARLALESALSHEPANPKHLDLLIETCILEGDKERALAVFGKLKEVNPENQKLGALYERVMSLPARDEPAQDVRKNDRPRGKI